MRNGDPVLLGAGRYIQAEGALAAIGPESKAFGKKAFIIGGETALSITLETLKKSLEDERIEYSLHRFKGYCTKPQIARISEEAGKAGANFIIGVGGGKCIDTAKAVAGMLGLRVVTVPTTAATCAAYAILSVMYSDDGAVLETMFHKREAAAIIVDMDVIARKCPVRMLASGIGDAFAKFPEIAHSMKHSDEMEGSVLPCVALELAKYNSDILMEKAAKACRDVSRQINSQDVEDTVITDIALTGVVSALVSGGRQLAIAHAFYNAVCAHFGGLGGRYLHGERGRFRGDPFSNGGQWILA